jgi:hypothetical protein
MPLVEQELYTIPEHLSSLPVFSGDRVTRALVLYVCFVDRCLSVCLFTLCCLSFDVRILSTIRTSKERQHNGHKIPKGYSESVHQRTDNTMATRYQRGTQNTYIKGQTTQLCCLSFDVRILSTHLVSCGHCVVCPLMYGF